MYQATVRNSMAWDANGTIRSDWLFDTVRSNSAMGTFRGMAQDLPHQPVIHGDDEDDYDSDTEVHGSIDTGAATKGSDPIQLGGNVQAAHSTIIIKPLPSPESEKDISTLLASDASSAESSDGPKTPPQDSPLGAPPAYSGSMRASRRSSYAARNMVNGSGTVVREADVGNGIDTIRPIKKVDAAGSLRLSHEFISSQRREGSTSTPSSPTIHRRTTSELGQAGTAILDEVVLPVIQKVVFLRYLSFPLLTGHCRPYTTTWTPGRLSH